VRSIRLRVHRAPHFPVPMSAPGVSVLDDWDTLGMRATGSRTVLLDRVFVPEGSVSLRRPCGRWHPAWAVVLTVAAPIYMSAYLGIAEAARDFALAAVARKEGARQLPWLAGELENHLAQARFAWSALVANAAGYDFEPVIGRANDALIGKTLCTNAVVATVHKAMELTGGAGYFRKYPLERMLRDIPAAPYHPLPEKRQIHFTGRLALGCDPITGDSCAAWRHVPPVPDGPRTTSPLPHGACGGGGSPGYRSSPTEK